jgi:hypothetical protein
VLISTPNILFEVTHRIWRVLFTQALYRLIHVASGIGAGIFFVALSAVEIFFGLTLL